MQQYFVTVTSSESQEWYTPPKYTNLARGVMGSIDLDPASSVFPQEWIRAKKWYTREDNGLLYGWRGNVWLNPPYGEIKRRDEMGHKLSLPEWYTDLCLILQLPFSVKNQELWSRYLESEYLGGNVNQAVLLVRGAFGYEWLNYLLRRWPCITTWQRIPFINLRGNTSAAKVATCFFYFGKQLDVFLNLFGSVGFYCNKDVWNGRG